MRISELNWKYQIRETDEYYMVGAEHVLIAADPEPGLRLAVYTPCWQSEVAGTAFICSACTAFTPELDATDKLYAGSNVGRLIEYIVSHHQDYFGSTFYRLINELPELESLVEQTGLRPVEDFMDRVVSGLEGVAA